MWSDLQPKLDKTVEIFQADLAGVRAGRASAGLVDNLPVDVYGSVMPLKQIASVAVSDSRSLAIQPWDRANLGLIEKAISKSDLGLSPINDGILIRINIPPLSTERRDELVKLVRQKAEAAKVALRNLRHETFTKIDQQGKNKEIGEDEKARLQKQVQDKIDDYTARVEEALHSKEVEIATV
ncbi:MAG: ribosome recycling factor [bacterium]